MRWPSEGHHGGSKHLAIDLAAGVSDTVPCAECPAAADRALSTGACAPVVENADVVFAVRRSVALAALLAWAAEGASGARRLTAELADDPGAWEIESLTLGAEADARTVRVACAFAALAGVEGAHANAVAGERARATVGEAEVPALFAVGKGPFDVDVVGHALGLEHVAAVSVALAAGGQNCADEPHQPKSEASISPKRRHSFHP